MKSPTQDHLTGIVYDRNFVYIDPQWFEGTIKLVLLTAESL